MTKVTNVPLYRIGISQFVNEFRSFVPYELV